MSIALMHAERSVPRYTSYPTAPHFSAAVGPETYGTWLAALPSDTTLSLYLHIPFCVEICHYCGCHTKAARRADPIERYADRLVEEIALIGARTGRGKVVHLHWGGGTPSILPAAQMRRIMAAIAERFDLSALREHAIELDPRRMSPALAETLAGIGVNRASLGVQDLSAKVQQAIGRIQPFEVVASAVEALRNAGINRINLDLMYGLPLQTVDSIRRNAGLAATLAPQRLAIFGYAHVPWMKKNQRLIDEAALPGLAERIAQAEAASQTLRAHGYVPIGLDHFARPDDELTAAARSGKLHRNFQGYTTDPADALIGLGASAIGKLPQGFVQNAVDTGGWSRSIEAGELATVKGLALTGDDRLRAQLIERLMCDLSLDLDALAGDAAGAFDEEIASLAPLADEGVVHIDGRRISVTPRGRPFVRLVAAAFDAYLPQRQARHSIAV